eukprot:scaffold10301_cov121-Isochrysis_galbana.AAC.3
MGAVATQPQPATTPSVVVSTRRSDQTTPRLFSQRVYSRADAWRPVGSAEASVPSKVSARLLPLRGIIVAVGLSMHSECAAEGTPSARPRGGRDGSSHE